PYIVTAIAQASLTSDLVSATLYIYCTWDLIYSSNPQINGSNTANMCFVENALIGRIGELISAHEVGHALGLPHSRDQADLLMTPIVSNDFLDMCDIESANRL